MSSFDIIIPVGPDDCLYIYEQVQYTIKNVIGFEKIYILCYNIDEVLINNPKIKTQNVILISESIFPFKIKTIADIHGKNPRNGWYLQQLLKLYAGFVIPGINERYLVIDADTYFLKPTIFFENDIPLYNVGDHILERNENHKPYFEHMLRLHPEFEKVSPYSGISHHMVFETKFIKEIMDIVEKRYENKDFWKIFLEQVDIDLRNVTPYPKSGASEYEFYFNYIIKYHPNEIKIRILKRRDVSEILDGNDNDYQYVSCHYRMRNK